MPPVTEKAAKHTYPFFYLFFLFGIDFHPQSLLSLLSFKVVFSCLE